MNSIFFETQFDLKPRVMNYIFFDSFSIEQVERGMVSMVLRALPFMLEMRFMTSVLSRMRNGERMMITSDRNTASRGKERTRERHEVSCLILGRLSI